MSDISASAAQISQQNICYDVENTSALIIGDADQNEKVTISDASFIQKAIAEYFTLNSLQNILCDVNGDKNVNIKDCAIIQKYIAEYAASDSLAGKIYQPVTTTPVSTSATTPSTVQTEPTTESVETTAATTVAPTSNPTVPATTQPVTAAKNYIYLQNDASWSNCYVYTWKTGSQGEVSWPGTKMENVSGNLFRYELTTDADMIIFNGGYNQAQTADLSIPSGSNNVFSNGTNTWSKTIQPTTSATEPISTSSTTPTVSSYDKNEYLFLYNAAGWSSCYANVWNDNYSSLSSSATVKMTYVSNNIYKVKVDANDNSVIFSSGTGQKSAEHSFVFSDLTNL